MARSLGAKSAKRRQADAELPRILEQHGVIGHEQALGKLQQQLAGYHDFLRREVLPRY